MDEAETLTRLVAHAEQRGSDLLALRAIAEEASELGAARALARLGLSDEGAGGDVRELRELLATWRLAKRSAWSAAINWVVRALGAALLVGIAVRLGLAERVFG